MNTFMLDIKGQLNSIHLSETKALWPLYEAVVNAIQSIEDSPNKENGQIRIRVVRESVIQTNLFDDKKAKILSFVITDNGSGFNEQNYRSFNTAYSTLKIHKGCKGIGRFLWLKAFKEVVIKSNYYENNHYYSREFSFTAEGINPLENVKTISETRISTSVELKELLNSYKESIPLKLVDVAKRVIEHCLPFFLLNNCPEIMIEDECDSINLNQYFVEHIKDSMHQDRFFINNEEFVLYHLRLYEGITNHELHLCANKLEVETIDIKKHIPNLNKKIVPNDESSGFYYVGYVTSNYLDSIVNASRTTFNFEEKDAQIALIGTSKDEIVNTSIEYIKIYLEQYLKEIKDRKKKQIDEFVEYDRPAYRMLLNKKPDVYDEIPVGLKSDALELELHKQMLKWEMDIKEKSLQLDRAIKSEDISSGTYYDLFMKYWVDVSDMSKTCLAEYVTRRKTLLTMLENVLSVKEDGRFPMEEAIHSIICPMRHTSDDISFEEMNLWIIDERLAYHRYLASDKTLKSMPLIDSKSTKEPDIAIFDQAFAYSDNDEPFTSITIIEFKKPDNDTKNPINQVLKYVDLIRSGGKKKENGHTFTVTEGTVFRCYIICDITEKMRDHCMNANLLPTSDNIGFSGYNTGRHAFIEVISYNKLLSDAKKRNQIFFEKLFSPNITSMCRINEEKSENK